MIRVSASVWFEQVDIGLIEEIKNTVRVQNSKGVLVPLEDENSVIVRKPEEDFKIETFPCVSIYNLTSKFQPIRYVSDPVVVGKDLEKLIATVEDSAIPYELLYQIDFWAKYQEDMNQMTLSWLSRHFRQFNLKVTDSGGTERTCNCLKDGELHKSDLVLGGERLFHSIISYRIWVEIDEETSYNVPIVGDIEITDSILKRINREVKQYVLYCNQ